MIAKPEPGSTLRKVKMMDPDTDSALKPWRGYRYEVQKKRFGKSEATRKRIHNSTESEEIKPAEAPNLSKNDPILIMRISKKNRSHKFGS
jgi:hypothetical protein